jgi:hypothetical protein
VVKTHPDQPQPIAGRRPLPDGGFLHTGTFDPGKDSLAKKKKTYGMKETGR